MLYNSAYSDGHYQLLHVCFFMTDDSCLVMSSLPLSVWLADTDYQHKFREWQVKSQMMHKSPFFFFVLSAPEAGSQLITTFRICWVGSNKTSHCTSQFQQHQALFGHDSISKHICSNCLSQSEEAAQTETYSNTAHQQQYVAVDIIFLQTGTRNTILHQLIQHPLAALTSMRKSPVLSPACHATPPSSTDSRYCSAGKAGVGVNSSMGVSAAWGDHRGG